MDPDSVPPYRHRAYRLDPDPDDTEPKTMSFISFKEQRFGRNGIYWPAFIHLVCLCLFIWGDHWGAYVAGGVVIGALWVASFIDWRNLQKIDHSRKDGHTKAICDLCDPICYAGDGSPLDLLDWYATKYKLPRALVVTEAEDWSGDFMQRQIEAHNVYLSHKKFRNYPRP